MLKLLANKFKQSDQKPRMNTPPSVAKPINLSGSSLEQVNRREVVDSRDGRLLGSESAAGNSIIVTGNESGAAGSARVAQDASKEGVMRGISPARDSGMAGLMQILEKSSQNSGEAKSLALIVPNQ